MRPHHHTNLMRALVASAALASLAACSTVSSMIGMGGGMSASQQASDVNASVRSDADIMGVLHMSNVGEINAGTVAQQRASDGEVRNFASMMVREHSNVDQQGSRMAQQWGISPSTPSNNLPSVMQGEMDSLNGASNGTSFDRVYIQSQVVDHQRTLAIVDAAIGSAQRGELRAMLRDQVRPAVASHLSTAQSIQARIGTP